MKSKNVLSDQHDSDSILTRRGRALVGLAGVGLTAGIGYGLYDTNKAPEMEGTQIVKIDTGDTVYDIATDNVDGGASDTRSVIDYIVDQNPNIFENGKATLGSEDLGKDLVIPESVQH